MDFTEGVYSRKHCLLWQFFFFFLEINRDGLFQIQEDCQRDFLYLLYRIVCAFPLH